MIGIANRVDKARRAGTASVFRPSREVIIRGNWAVRRADAIVRATEMLIQRLINA